MTTEELTTYYANLLILQYLGQPKAVATVANVVTPALMDQLPLSVQGGYDLGTAVGVQLDVLGKYVGVTRNNYTLTGPVSLDDADFLQLIKMVIIKNNAGSSLATIQNLLAVSFPGQVLISDSQDMTLNYVILESLGSSDLLGVLVVGGYLPRPMAVQISVVIEPVHEFPFFGFRTYADPTPASPPSPFNSYPFYQLIYPWLSSST